MWGGWRTGSVRCRVGVEAGRDGGNRNIINQSPGCLQGMILAPKPAAWLLLPGSGAFGT